jgi:hypothetical protein
MGRFHTAVKWTRSCLQRHAKSGRRKEAHNDNLYLLVVFHLNCCIINNYETQLGVLPRLLHFSTEEPNFFFLFNNWKIQSFIRNLQNLIPVNTQKERVKCVVFICDLLYKKIIASEAERRKRNEN